jgi:hypothetical protein
MKATKKSLQKFTESERKINEILVLEQIYPDNLKGLTKEELDKVCKILTEKLNEAKGEEKDKIVRKIENFVSDQIKNELWEYNHSQITWAISNFINENNRMPSKGELVVKTGLSRQTIYKHLKEYTAHPEFKGHLEQFRFMTEKVLAKVFHFAVNGDMRAAKLFLEIFSTSNIQKPGNTLIQNQNNYIQINGTVLNPDIVTQLSPEQLIQIESIIKAVAVKSNIPGPV